MDQQKNMRVLQGSSASSGITMGFISLYTAENEEAVPHYIINPGTIDQEIQRFSIAQEKSAQSVITKIEKAKETSDSQAKEIFVAHLAILNDPGMSNNVAKLIRKRHINAEHAVSDVFEMYIKRYEKTNSHFNELIHDLIDIRDGLLGSFGTGGGRFICPVNEREPVIVVTKTLVPSMLMDIPRENVRAFVTEEGGYTTHATILARSYGVPVIFGIPFDGTFNCGDHAVVDSSLGKVILHPDAKTQEYYEFRIEKIKQRKSVCIARLDQPLSTTEGAQIKLKVNVSVPFELALLKNIYYDGIGLLRTEFLFQGHEPPAEDAQLAVYKQILEQAGSREVVVRLLDIGSDKMPSYLNLPEQVNPDLGIRGARAVEYFYDIYISQAKALLRAGEHGNLKILFPMVSDLSDLVIYRKLIEDAHSQLNNSKKEYTTGVMIETPSSALLADQFLKEVDFVNIGSNDLLQYTLAASRGNTFAEKRYHIVHPALIKLCEMVIHAGKKYRKEVCLCGEIASFEEFYPLFLEMGLRSFSVPAAKYEDLKCHVSFMRVGKKETLVKKIYQSRSKEQVDQLFRAIIKP